MEKRLLRDIATFTTGKLNSNAAAIEGKYPFFTCAPKPLRINDYRFDRKAILLAGNNAEGNFHITYYEGKFNAYQRTYVITVKDESITDIKYLYYALSQCLNQFKMISQGTATKFLTAQILNSFEIPILPINVQSKVSWMLTAIDDKIQVNQQINDNLYEMVNAYYASLFNEAESQMTTIGKYAERIYSGGTPSTSNAAYWNGAFGWFSSGETRNRFVASTEKTITQEGVDNSSTKLAAKYDIVIASAGQGFTRGQTSMLLLDTYINQSVIVIHADGRVLPYLFWNLTNRYKELRAISDSSSIRGSLTTKMISAFEIPLADEASMKLFADFAWSVIPQIENNLLENKRLTSLRDSLLPKLMSGEIDVSDVQL